MGGSLVHADWRNSRMPCLFPSDTLAAQGGFPITSIREIRILRNLQHENIVELLEVVTDSRGSVTDGKVSLRIVAC